MNIRAREIRLPILFSICATVVGVPGAFGEELPSDGSREESYVDQAARLIERQVAHFGERPHGLSGGFFHATAIMNFVQSRLSPLNYAILARAGEPVPTDPESCLSMGAGICGNQVATFLLLADSTGLRARSVEFYMHGETPEENFSHICAEVYYDGKWRLFDVTWGTVFRRNGSSRGGLWRLFDVTWGTVFRRNRSSRDDLMSAREVLESDHPRQYAVSNRTDVWFEQWMATGRDPLVYVDWSDTDILLGHSGTINLRPHPDSGDGSLTYVPMHQPNHFGRLLSTVDGSSVETRLKGISGEVTRVTIDVAFVAGTGVLVIKGARGAVEMPVDETTTGLLDLSLDGLEIEEEMGWTVRTKQSDEIGCVFFNEIRLEVGAD